MKLAVVSTDPEMRRRLTAWVAELPEVTVMAEATPGEAIDFVRGRSAPQAILWSQSWTDPSPTDLRRVARAGIPVVCLVSSSEEARRAESAGAAGVLSHSSDLAAVAAALAAVVAGLTVHDPQMDPGGIAGSTEPENGIEALTSREMDVLRLMAEGLSNRAVALRLGIRESTVKDHVNAILGKLDAESRTEAVILGLRKGLLTV